MGISRRRLIRRADRQPRDADVVVTVSPSLAETMRRRGVDPVLIPNGCDVTLFSRTSPPTPGEAPTVAYVGHLSDRVDVRLLEAVADSGVDLLLIGPRQETMTAGLFDAVLSRPNVRWAGPVPYADLPASLAEVSTCLLPYADSEFNRASFPLKILEYLAAGRRVVSTGLPAVRWLDTDLVDVADTPASFAAAVAASTAEPLRSDEIAGRRAFAAGHSWESRAGTLAETLQLGARR